VYSDELELNNQFRRFVVNASLLYGGHNTVAEQLNIHKSWAANKGHQSPMQISVVFFNQSIIRS